MGRSGYMPAWATVRWLVPLMLVTAGCGGNANVGAVSGTVTLDGQPLAGATVTFAPRKRGSPSSGRTGSNGKYFLQYTRDVQGAEIGEHTVTITTYSEGDPDADPPVAPTSEKVPAKYNVKSELTKAVKGGTNTIDFTLESDGPTGQPE